MSWDRPRFAERDELRRQLPAVGALFVQPAPRRSFSFLHPKVHRMTRGGMTGRWISCFLDFNEFASVPPLGVDAPSGQMRQVNAPAWYPTSAICR